MRFLKGLPLVVVLFALAACGGGAATNASSNTSIPTIKMSASNFEGATSLTIKAGQSVLFDDTFSGGGTHVLVTGMNGMAAPEAGAPAVLNAPNQDMFTQDDATSNKQTITFPTAGTYTIVCTVHPAMLVTITVQ